MPNNFWDDTLWRSRGSATARYVVDKWVGQGKRSNIMSLDVHTTLSDPEGVGVDVDAVFLGASVTHVREKNPQ